MCDIAGIVAVDATFLAVLAGDVAVGVTSPAGLAGNAPPDLVLPADAEVASSVDRVGVVSGKCPARGISEGSRENPGMDDYSIIRESPAQMFILV